VSNAIRSLGYLVLNVNYELLKKVLEENLNHMAFSSSGGIYKLHQEFLQKCNEKIGITTGDVLKLIIENIENKSPKISWNACVSLGNILRNKSISREEVVY
jgi:hypothetical protein